MSGLSPLAGAQAPAIQGADQNLPSGLQERELSERGRELALPPSGAIPVTLRWGPQRPDLLRYNRVEGLSIGVRGQVRPHAFGGPLSLTATLRLGSADLEPNLGLDVSRETPERKVTLYVFNELTPIDEQARHFGVANSLLAATVGRDDGDYYRRSGAWFELRPPTAAQQTFSLRAFAEYHRSALAETDFALAWLGDDSRAFRQNLAADEGWEYGVLAELTPWWGSDPNRVRGGFDVSLRAAAGDFRYVRASALATLAIPLPADFRFGVEAAAGTAWDSPSAQRQFYLGGPSTLRGYAPRRLAGTSFGRTRAEVGRLVAFGALSVFGELGWAGARDQIAFADTLYSVGTGLSILDGMIRVDAGWGLRDPTSFRLDLYLDAIR